MIYEYYCEKCDEVVEVHCEINEEPNEYCVVCNNKMKKLISKSTFSLQGGGWYKDGYSK